MNNNPQKSVGDIGGAIAAIRTANLRQLLVELNGVPDVNYGGSILLRAAVDLQNAEAVKILLERGARSNESIMELAVKSECVEIIKRLADAEPAMIVSNEYRVLELLFAKLIRDWDNPVLNECFDHLYGKLKANRAEAIKAFGKVNTVRAAFWVKDRLRKDIDKKFQRPAGDSP